MALRQCPKRLWLELHRPDLREDSAATEASFQVGDQVGDIARHIYDPDGRGTLINIERDGFGGAFQRTQELLQKDQPIFEAGFSANGGLAFADVMLPSTSGGQRVWRIVEVKSSTSVKDYHRDDIAVQAYVATSNGVSLHGVALAHIDNTWTYAGDGDYQGLLKETDLTAEALARADEVKSWIAQAQDVDALPTAPEINVGPHCSTPFACGFYNYCSKDLPQAQHPAEWLPYFGAKARTLATQGIIELADVPDALLNPKQQRVKTHTLANTVYFDAASAAEELAAYSLPAYFLDFESVQFAVPIWKGTRPYQQNCFQFSLHILDAAGSLSHEEFLDVSGNDPALPFAQTLVELCGENGPVYVYNAAFERSRINELAARFAHCSAQLLAISARLVDLLPIARQHYYHPSQQGSWSIKSVLPAAVPELSYQALEGVQDGGMAMEAFQEAIRPTTTAERKEKIREQLLAYCKLDTYAMVRLWQVFAGRTDMRL